MFYRLLNASVFSVSAPQISLCERDSVISVCQMWHVLSSLLHLFNDPDIAMERTCCIVGHPARLVSHCACEPLYRQDCITCLQTAWSREEMMMPFIYAPFSAPYRDFGGLLKPHVCVWQCHRREGGAEDLFTSLLLNCLRCKREKKLTLTLHCTKICVRFLSYFYRGETVEIHCCSVHVWIFVLHPYWYELGVFIYKNEACRTVSVGIFCGMSVKN